MTDELLTPDELCVRLKISRKGYQRLVLKGLPCRFVLMARRYVLSEVLAWLPKGPVIPKTKTVPPPPMLSMTKYLKAQVALLGRR